MSFSHDAGGDPRGPGDRLPAAIGIGLAVFAVWTLVYQLSLPARIPARMTLIIFLALLAPLVWFCLRLRDSRPGAAPPDWRFRFRAAFLALLAGVTFLVLCRPDPDDLDFFHRALWQLERPGEAFAFRDTIHNRPGLPLLSPAHYVSAYEPLAALAGSLTGIGPLQVYHNISVLLAAAGMVTVYILLYRELGLGKGPALASAAIAVIFLLLDGNLHRSFGNFGPARCWQGKVIVVLVMVPLALLLSLRFLRRPSPRDLLALVLAGIAAGGLSPTVIFLVPLLVFSVSLANLFSGWGGRGIIRRGIILNLTALYPAALVVVIFLAAGSLIPDISVWQENVLWPGNWRDNLGLVLGGNAPVIRDLAILFLLPAAALRGRSRRLLWGLSVVLIILFFNPLTGPLWLGLLQPGAYWRLAYLLPLPLCAGLLPACIRFGPGRTPKRIFAGLAAAAVIVTGAAAFRSSVLGPPAFLKSPFALRFPPRPRRLVRASGLELAGRNVLAPPQVVWVAGLLYPETRFEATRPLITGHIYRNAGLEAEGRRRILAQRAVWRGDRSAEAEEAFLLSLAGGVDTVVSRSRHREYIEGLLEKSGSRWQAGTGGGGYLLFRKSLSTPGGKK